VTALLPPAATPTLRSAAGLAGHDAVLAWEKGSGRVWSRKSAENLGSGGGIGVSAVSTKKTLIHSASGSICAKR